MSVVSLEAIYELGNPGSYLGSFQQLLNGREKTDSKQVIGTDSRNTSDDEKRRPKTFIIVHVKKRLMMAWTT